MVGTVIPLMDEYKFRQVTNQYKVGQIGLSDLQM